MEIFVKIGTVKTILYCVKVKVKVKVKVNVTLEQTTKAQSWSRGIALFFL